jgi:hypothetical protein
MRTQLHNGNSWQLLRRRELRFWVLIVLDTPNFSEMIGFGFVDTIPQFIVFRAVLIRDRPAPAAARDLIVS